MDYFVVVRRSLAIVIIILYFSHFSFLFVRLYLFIFLLFFFGSRSRVSLAMNAITENRLLTNAALTNQLLYCICVAAAHVHRA